MKKDRKNAMPLLVLMIVLAVSAGLTGCQFQKNSRKPEVGVIVKSTQSSFWKAVQAGASAASTEYNLSLIHIYKRHSCAETGKHKSGFSGWLSNDAVSSGNRSKRGTSVKQSGRRTEDDGSYEKNDDRKRLPQRAVCKNGIVASVHGC